MDQGESSVSNTSTSTDDAGAATPNLTPKSTNSADTAAADNETLSVTSTVQAGIVNPLIPLGVEGNDAPQRPPQRIHHARARTISALSTPQLTSSSSRQGALEHLTDMGPLEQENKETRENALGAQLIQEPLVLPSPLSTTTAVEATHRPSFSTPASKTSQSTSESATIKKSTDQEGEAESMAWSGGHPLLMDYTEEPERLDEGTYHDQEAPAAVRSAHQPYVRGLHRKGHTMSVDSQQRSASYHQEGDDGSRFEAGLGSNARRRKNVSKEKEDRSWKMVPEEDKTATAGGTGGKRVIIHTVAVTDTLAGIALYYGIQVPVLKKSNKLWTNDSIHTRKYLYIPFEECTVARQAGVMVDESNQTVILPQRIQHHHHHHPSRPASTYGTLSFTNARLSTYENMGPSSQLSGNIIDGGKVSAMREVGEVATDTGSVLGLVTPPRISAVAAGMLPSSLALSSALSPSTSSSSSSSVSPRVGTWVDTKSVAAPPVPSPTTTTTSLKSDNSLKAATHSHQQQQHPRRAMTDSTRSAAHGAGAETLPNTIVVPPSMTHEALAARFKEMDLVTSEQRQQQQQQQELRTNPVHQRHRTVDLRQFVGLQQQRLVADSAIMTTTAAMGRRSRSSSNAGSSRRSSVDVGVTLVNGVGTIEGNRKGAGPIDEKVEEENEDADEGAQDDQQRQQQTTAAKDPKEFVAFGHQQHIYDTDDLLHQHGSRTASSSSTGVDESEGYDGADSLIATVSRRQELVTVPAGMLSFFPSPEHSKKLETPQSISRIQNQIDNASFCGSLSGSSTVSSGSFRERASSVSSAPSSQHGRKVAGTAVRAKGRVPLSEQTFVPPTSPSSSRNDNGSKLLAVSVRTATQLPSPQQQQQQQRRAISSSTTTAPLSPTISKSAYSKTVRIKDSYYSPEKWSLMGESLVDDILGAVRGPLQIARRMYNFSTLGFGSSSSTTSADSSNSNTGKASDYFDPPGVVRRRSSTRRTSRGSLRNKEFRSSSGSVIELATTTATTSTTTAVAMSKGEAATYGYASITKRTPAADENSEGISSGLTRRTSNTSSSGGGAHFRGGSSSSTHSTRKRSLRSSNPVNHAALMALVNELDKDNKREKERGRGRYLKEEQEKTDAIITQRAHVIDNPLASSPPVSL
ncbi:hypothetical protein BGZ54_005154 [Gamsiella multidivaricata]|nr:hypothetical protein BGZ54_005154 [Gamsiella multidivaricata]